MAKYGIYGLIDNSADTEALKEAKTCLIFVGSAYNTSDFSKVFHIQSWDDFESAFGVDRKCSLTDAAVACLDMYGIPFYAIATDNQDSGWYSPKYFDNVYVPLSQFINDFTFDSYIVCCAGFDLGDLTSFIATLNPLLSKPVYYVCDLEASNFISGKRPNLAQISTSINRFYLRHHYTNISMTFGDVIFTPIGWDFPDSDYYVLGSTVRAALMATLPVYENAGNKTVECTGIYGRVSSMYAPERVPLIITESDADYLTARGVSVIMAKYGAYRTWGDTVTHGTSLTFSFENAVRMEQFLSIDLAKQCPSESMTLCDRDEIIRKENAYLDSLAYMGAIKSGYLEWVENGDTGKWKFNIEPEIPTPIKALTAKVGRSEFI